MVLNQNVCVCARAYVTCEWLFYKSLCVCGICALLIPVIISLYTCRWFVLLLQSEYPSERDERRGFISGFTGSAGKSVNNCLTLVRDLTVATVYITIYITPIYITSMYITQIYALQLYITGNDQNVSSLGDENI